ncbi:hypothetical protein BDB01DRAFT_834921 [Pilobolus umbonatus]|nr:hypothetical protein BDB01DRAFT_834921 [Pilobolus umbonatus]
MSECGIVKDRITYPDNLSGQIFRGNGHVILERSPDPENQADMEIENSISEYNSLSMERDMEEEMDADHKKLVGDMDLPENLPASPPKQQQSESPNRTVIDTISVALFDNMCVLQQMMQSEEGFQYAYVLSTTSGEIPSGNMVAYSTTDNKVDACDGSVADQNIQEAHVHLALRHSQFNDKVVWVLCYTTIFKRKLLDHKHWVSIFHLLQSLWNQNYAKTAIHNDLMESPALQGARLIQLYDTIFTVVHLSSVHISFNDTANIKSQIVRIINASTEPVTYQLKNYPIFDRTTAEGRKMSGIVIDLLDRATSYVTVAIRLLKGTSRFRTEVLNKDMHVIGVAYEDSLISRDTNSGLTLYLPRTGNATMIPIGKNRAHVPIQLTDIRGVTEKITLVAMDDDTEAKGRLSKILKHVEYVLHPSFNEQIRFWTNFVLQAIPEDAFDLKSPMDSSDSQNKDSSVFKSKSVGSSRAQSQDTDRSQDEPMKRASKEYRSEKRHSPSRLGDTENKRSSSKSNDRSRDYVRGRNMAERSPIRKAERSPSRKEERSPSRREQRSPIRGDSRSLCRKEKVTPEGKEE